VVSATFQDRPGDVLPGGRSWDRISDPSLVKQWLTSSAFWTSPLMVVEVATTNLFTAVTAPVSQVVPLAITLWRPLPPGDGSTRWQIDGK
jgi:hypothetical protein